MTYTDLDFNGKTYISSNRAGELTGYTNDYIGQLARAEKIKAKKIGRAWFVEKHSILAYKKNNTLLKKETTSIPSVYVSRVPILFTTRALVPVLVLIFMVGIFSITSYRPGQTLATPSLVAFEIKESFLGLSSRVNSRAQNFAQVPLKNISRGVEVVRTFSSNDLFVGLEIKDSLSNARMNLADSKKSISSIFSNTGARLNNALTELSVSVYTTINKSYALGFGFIKKHSPRKKLVLNINNNSQKQIASQSGLVVIPTSGDKISDEKERKKIKQRFSDEVSVVFDESGGSGVIMPVFRNANDQSYSFVLVPINHKTN